MISRNQPSIDLASLYISGLQIYFNDSTITNNVNYISAGECRDDSNSFNMSTEGIAFDPLKIGVNGRDSIGPSANGDYLYAVYLIGDSSKNKETACVLTLAINSNPWIPSGYDCKRLIGYLMSFNQGDGLSFQNCFSIGTSNNRKLILSCKYNDYPLITNASGNRTCDLTNHIPPVVNTPVYLFLEFQPTVAGNPVTVQQDTYIGQSASIPYTQNIKTYATFLSNLTGTLLLAVQTTNGGAGNLTSLSFLGFDYVV